MCLESELIECLDGAYNAGKRFGNWQSAFPSSVKSEVQWNFDAEKRMVAQILNENN